MWLVEHWATGVWKLTKRTQKKKETRSDLKKEKDLWNYFGNISPQELLRKGKKKEKIRHRASFEVTSGTIDHSRPKISEKGPEKKLKKKKYR